jgi:internalin A
LENLTILYLGGNQLTTLPEWLGRLTNLTKLDLSHNQLTTLPAELGQLTNLTELSLFLNQLTMLPAELGQLANLTSLYLGGNQQLTTLPEWLGQLANLTSLYLGGNQLTTLPEWLGRLTNLTDLNLGDNQLTTLPASLNNLTQLRALFLHGNEALGIPPEVLGPTWDETLDGQSGKKEPAIPKTILDYYFRPKSPINEAKLILVGFGEVGKTSLVERLVEGTFKTGKRKTEGIQITQWPIELGGGEPVRLHIWDFGGQEIMHSTHQFFLSQRSLYLLVLNGRQGHEDADAEYWMNLIRSFGGESPVIVVLNKQEEHAFDLNRKNLQAKFPGMVRKFIQTECGEKGTCGIEQLKTTILREIDQLEGLRDGFPVGWFKIKDRLAGMEENYLTFEQFRTICEESGEKAQLDQDKLAGYLHQLGIALNFKDDTRLRDMHVLNPRWVTQGIYAILNAKELEASKGELQIDCLEKILNRTAYPRERHLFLLNLMRKFYLCFEFPDRAGHYLIPDLLDKNQPDAANEFEPERCLNFEYRYPALHEGVIPSFITRTYILSEGQARWRTGVVLAFEGCRALVKADLTERQVRIAVEGKAGDSRRRLLAVIRHEFESIHCNFSFRPDEYVPVPDHPEVAIKYADLRVLEEKGIAKKQQVIGDDVLELDVRELLSGVDLVQRSRKGLQPMDAERNRALKMFYSYTHKDEALREELETHLKILQRQGVIDGWHDRRIMAGETWKDEIDQHLEDADIILLLISADFIASDYCYKIEMKRALERHAAGEARVIPIILRDVSWGKAPFSKLQALPKDAKPVTKWRNRDSAWKNVAEGIEKVTKVPLPDKPDATLDVERLKEMKQAGQGSVKSATTGREYDIEPLLAQRATGMKTGGIHFHIGGDYIGEGGKKMGFDQRGQRVGRQVNVDGGMYGDINFTEAEQSGDLGMMLERIVEALNLAAKQGDVDKKTAVQARQSAERAALEIEEAKPDKGKVLGSLETAKKVLENVKGGGEAAIKIAGWVAKAAALAGTMWP